MRYVVVGGGLIGSYVAWRLAAKGYAVDLVEQGKSFEEEYLKSVGTNKKYRGGSEGRKAGLGGTSQVWGGLLVEPIFSELDNKWRYLETAISENASAVKKILGVEQQFLRVRSAFLGSNDILLESESIVSQVFVTLPILKRNIFFYFIKTKKRDKKNINIWKDLRVNRICHQNNKINSIECSNPQGRTMLLPVGKLILCTGALGNVQILARLLGSKLRTEHGLSDHLSCRVARVNVLNAKEFYKNFSPRVLSRGTIIGRRLILKNTAIPHYFTFQSDRRNQLFRIVKILLRGDFKKFLVEITKIKNPFLEIMLLIKYFVAGGMVFSETDEVFLHLDFSSEISKGGDIGFESEAGIDAINGPLLGRSDFDAIDRFLKSFYKAFQLELSDICELNPLPSEAIRESISDTYHPCGVYPILANGAINLDGRVRDFDNLFVTGTGLLPDAGNANPTFAALCLSEHMVNAMVEEEQ